MAERVALRDKSWRRRIPAISILAAGVLAALIVTALALFWRTNTGNPLVAAVISNEAGEPQAIIEDFGGERVNVILLADIDVASDKVLEAWTMPTGYPSPLSQSPVSLGTLEGARALFLASPKLAAPQPGQTYLLTLEPRGGSPTGQPSETIIGRGQARRPL